MISLKSVWKFYDDVRVLKNISYNFHSAKIYNIRGENGAGKSSLLSVISGQGSYQEGEVLIDVNGKLLNIEKLSSIDLSSCFPLQGCYEKLSPKENLELVSVDNEKFSLDEILKLFGLEKYQDTPYHNLSKGYQQRTSLAVAFSNNSKWIILDEPTVYLDVNGVSCLKNAIHKYFNAGSTFIICSHDTAFLTDLDCVQLSLNKGELLSE